jgi:ferredoxin
MKIEVDLGACRSYGLCAGVAPDVFEINEEGVLQLLQADVDDSRRAEMEDAALMCPTQAIRLVDA